jgi:hypothetical protein
VATIEPAGLDSGDEELRAVATVKARSVFRPLERDCDSNLRVGAGVGHGEKTGAGVLLDEVLIGELLAIDGLATGALLYWN